MLNFSFLLDTNISLLHLLQKQHKQFGMYLTIEVRFLR